jgi:hypothetical protein
MGKAVKVAGVVVGFVVLVLGTVKLVALSPRHHTEVVSISSGRLGQVCDLPRHEGFPDAPANTGAGPHPIVVVGFSDSTDESDKSQWAAAWKPQRKQIQLIACIDHVDDGNQILGFTCHYNIPIAREVPIVETTTQLSLYEARTGHKVADVSVSSGASNCPQSTVVSGDFPTVEATPGYAEYEEALSQYVDK